VSGQITSQSPYITAIFGAGSNPIRKIRLIWNIYIVMGAERLQSHAGRPYVGARLIIPMPIPIGPFNYPGGLTLRFRFPQFKPIAFKVGRPAKSSVLMILCMIIDCDARRAQFSQHRSQIVYNVIDHERGAAG